ncbi:MAG TPA: 16S rRNA (adenine(1518)-N(6)/adenine(1519)-N(6))-dimethyltransferase RsmA [Anaerolineales bacterium]
MRPNLNRPAIDVTGLLRRYGLHPDKRLGQNFLVDESALNKIVEIAEVGSDDTVLEVGPGLGSLTSLLATQARRVVAVELDENLLPPLREALASYSNVELVQGDILALDTERLIGEASYRVVANIPYYITSALIRHLLEAKARPVQMVLTVQREVAERITARPGDMSLLALSVQVYGRPEVMARIPAGAFYPAPTVDSAVVRVGLYPEPILPAKQLDAFFRLAKAGFSQKRKTLRNALAGGMHWSPVQAEAVLRAAGIDPKRRAETLSLEEWGRLVAS